MLQQHPKMLQEQMECIKHMKEFQHNYNIKVRDLKLNPEKPLLD